MNTPQQERIRRSGGASAPLDVGWGRADDIAAAPGLLWKVWTENEAGQRADGVYLFADAASAAAFKQTHLARLESFGVTDIRALAIDVNVPLSETTRAPLR